MGSIRTLLAISVLFYHAYGVVFVGGSLAVQALADAKAEDDDFQLMISDVNMPDIDGLMLAEEVLAKELMDPASVIMLTSGARPDDSAKLQALGHADGCASL